MRSTYIEEEESMSESMCRHQREKLLGIPQTGACYVCCPWMFPNADREEARAAYENWHAERGMPAPSHRTSGPSKPTPNQVVQRFLWRKWTRNHRARARV